MESFRSIRVIRLLLAICVSLWLAGAGCLFGCSYGPGAIVEARAASNSVVSGPSCHATSSHDCCAKKQHTKLDKTATPSRELMINAVPSGMMSDCPLAVNQIAAVSQVKSDTSASVPVQSAIPRIGFADINHRSASTPLSIPNRGPTHVLHCVFLI